MTSTSTRRTRAGQQPPEMLEKSHLHETFFTLKGAALERPMSVATEFMVESDWDDDEILSDTEDVEEECEESPRGSMHSSGQPSITTLSSYEEAHTPRSSRPPTAFQVVNDAKPVEGPRGPHLFRSSMLSAEYQNALTLSPLTPKTVKLETEFQLPIALDLTPLPTPRRHSGPFRFTDEELDTTSLAEWSPEKVAQWMLNAGVELQFAERFIENDITGGVLITLKFEDLKELGIPSFGVRTQIWEEIHVMRDLKPSEPTPETPIEDEPDRAVRREQREKDDEDFPRRGASRRKKAKAEDIISPLESVSIVGIEQMMPKPHHCSKGENCPKWRRNQRMIEAFKNDHPFVDMEKGGIIMVAGNPGNPQTAEAFLRPIDDAFRPVSDAIPSVVASSDVMGPGLPALQYLQEAALRNIQAQDPQDNVRNFLDFQHQCAGDSSEVPPTPPFEIFPGSQQQQSPHEGLRSLPKLAIPGGGATPRSGSAPPPRAAAAAAAAAAAPAHPLAYTQTIARSPSPEATPAAPYRFGTPFSDMDVPVTAVNLGPVARDFSQSVPPDMNYRHNPAPPPPARSMSRASARRPSFPVLPALDENAVASSSAAAAPRLSPAAAARNAAVSGHQRPLHPPPRVQYPWTTGRTEKAIAPVVPASASSTSVVTGSATTKAAAGGAVASSAFSTSSAASTSSSSPSPSSSSASVAAYSASAASASSSPFNNKVPPKAAVEGVTYQGPMRKRKTRMLRHEWHEHFFTLKGTRLAMHKDARTADRTLEYIDIDDYAIACSSLASSSKLNAAFKAMSITRRGGSSSDDTNSRSKDDAAAFAFQLIPQDARGGVRLLRKRESAVPAPPSAATAATAAAAASATTATATRMTTTTTRMTPPPPPPAAQPSEGSNGTGKAHHFAVKNRDERIDWMRELMLAKALKQKGEGFEVSVNGSMI